MTRPTTPATRRPGFTLVELLVAMAVIIALASIALIVVPDVLTQDRTTDGAGTVRQTLMIAKARALRDKAPRGVRFLVGTDPNGPAKPNGLCVTEMQLVEQPPDLVPSPDEEIVVTFATSPGPTPPAGALVTSLPTSPTVVYRTPGTAGSTVILDYLNGQTGAGPDPVLSFDQGDDEVTLRIDRSQIPATGLAKSPAAPVNGKDQYPVPLRAGQSFDVLMRAAGASTSLGLTGFRVKRPVQPLLGEPTVPLPRNVCVDMASSNFQWTDPAADFDIVFNEYGEVVVSVSSTNVSQIFLWVRDHTKPGGDPVFYTGATADRSPVADPPKGGEQQVVAVSASSGRVGVFPIHLPPGGTYPAGEDAFKFAKEGG